MMKKLVLTLAILLLSAPVFAKSVPNMPALAAVQKLKDGNARFVSVNMKHPNISTDRRIQITETQHPFAVIVSCSDSRVPPEIIFDQGLGDLFVIRNAGNVLDEHILGSIEYAVHHLGVNLVVVLGHGSCGAVGAAMSDEKESPEIESIKKSIEPAITLCKKENHYSYEEVIKAHAKMDVDNILKDKDVANDAKSRGVLILPAFYDLKTGKVEFLKK